MSALLVRFEAKLHLFFKKVYEEHVAVSKPIFAKNGAKS